MGNAGFATKMLTAWQNTYLRRFWRKVGADGKIKSMDTSDLIVVDPDILGGTPVFKALAFR